MDASQAYRRHEYAAPPRTLVDVLEETVSRHGGAPALDDGEQVLSYRELWRQARTFAARLHEAGVRRGDRVGVRVSSGSRRLYIAILGTLVAGAAYVPVDADDPQERADLVFGEAGIAALVDDHGIRPVDDTVDPGRAADAGDDRGDTGRPHVDDDAWIIFTSGSTGTPKGVAVTHRSAAAFVDAEARMFCRDRPLGPGDRVLAGLSVAFDASCEEMWLAWRHGGCLVPAPRALVRSGIDLGPWLVSRRITVVSTVPTLASLWPIDTLAQVRLLIFGGEGLPPELAARLTEPDREVWNTYGPTEATVVACGARMTGEGPVRIGLPLDGWDLVVVDAQDRPVAPGEVGQLIIGGVGLARYLDPAKDAEKFAPMPTLGWERAYRSGDLVQLDPEGLLFVGRADEQVKLGGRRIELGEIDAALQALPGAAAGACAVQTTAAGHQVLVGYVAPHDAGFDVEAAQLRLRAELPAALVPRLTVVDDLPTRTSGKVDRAALPWPLPEDTPTKRASGDGASDLDGTAAWLAGQWRAVLGAEVEHPDDDFFSLGGGSLAAAQLVTLLRERSPRVTVGDLYDYPRLAAQAAMLDDLAPSPAQGPGAVREVRPVPLQAQVVQTLVSIVLLGVGAAKWVTALCTLGSFAHVAGVLGWLPGAPWWALALAWVVLFTPPGQMGLTVAVARTLLRGLTPGEYPRGGSVHLRLWAVERFAETIGAVSMAGAPWIIYYARALGAKVGRGADLHSLPPVTGMLTLGGGCAIEPEVDLSGHWLDGDVLRVGRVRVAAHATVGARSTLAPGARVGRGATVEAGSTVHGAVPAAQVWAGSPAQAVKGKWRGPWPQSRPPRARRWLVAYAVSAVGLSLVPVLSLTPALALLAWVTAPLTDPGAAVGPLLLAAPAATVLALAGHAGLVLALVRLHALGLTAGFHAVRSRVGWQVWVTERLLDQARTYLFPLYSSLATPVWLRALGARVGRGVEASTVLLLPSMTRIDDGAFLADDTLVAGYELHEGWMRVAQARVGKRAFLGNSGMTAPGRKVPRDGLVAVLSTAPPSSKAGTSWVGSPPTRLRRAKVDDDAAVARTFAPPTRLKVLRAAVEVCRVVPVVVTVCLAVVVAIVFAVLARSSPWVAVLMGPVVLAAAGAVAAGLTVAAKWVLVGRFRRIEHPLWSSFVWRNELADTFTETIAGPWFAWGATGTPALNLWLRAMGARIGRGVWCETYWLPEADLVDLGDGATVNRGCVLQTHLFHDRIMSMDTVTLGPGATMGPHGVILPAASLGAGSTVGPGSLVLRGDTVPAHTRWTGNPITPWDEDDARA